MYQFSSSKLPASVTFALEKPVQVLGNWGVVEYNSDSILRNVLSYPNGPTIARCHLSFISLICGSIFAQGLLIFLFHCIGDEKV